MLVKRLSPLRGSLRKPGSLSAWLRSFHHVRGEFLSGEHGNTKLVTKVVSIVIGEPQEAYVMVPTATGQAMQAAYINGKPKGASRTI